MRKISIIIVMLLFTTFCSVIVSGHDSKLVNNKNYEVNLKQVIISLIEGKELTNKQIDNSIPKTEEDYIEFMSYTDKDNKNNTAFWKLNNVIIQSAMNRDEKVFKSFLLFSEFVDGYFADDYFDDAEAVIEENPDLFCKIYPELPKEKVKRLNSFYEEHCI